MAWLSHPCVLLLVGGGLGANLRYWLGLAFFHRGWTAHFPWHTFAINVLGSFILGIVVVLFRDRPTWLHLLGTGVCGGFTTFSAFSIETVALLEERRWPAAVAYILGSVTAAVAGAFMGLKLAGR